VCGGLQARSASEERSYPSLALRIYVPRQGLHRVAEKPLAAGRMAGGLLMKAAAIFPILALAPLAWLPAMADQRQTASPMLATLSRTEAQDLIFFHDTRPIFLRLHIQIDGRQFQTSWSSYLDKLFDFLDTNCDLVLTKDELAHAPSLQQLLQQLQGVVAIDPDPAPQFSEVDTAPVDG